MLSVGVGISSVREFYSQKAAECLLASRQVHRLADKNALLHMAAAYIDLAIQMELGKERGHEISEPDPPSQWCRPRVGWN